MGLQVHLILDNYATHKHESVHRWLKRHKRFHLRRGIFASVPDLVASIEDYLAASNDNPKPYVWTATAESILAKVARARTTLDQVVS